MYNVQRLRVSTGDGSAKELVTFCDEQVKWGENNSWVIKHNLPHYIFS